MILGMIGLQIILTAFKLPGWVCLFHAWTGLDCPGCGMSRAGALMAQGKVLESLRFHPFSLLVALFFLAVAACALPPPRWRIPIMTSLVRWDQRLGITLFGMLAMLLWGMGRLALQVVARIQQ